MIVKSTGKTVPPCAGYESVWDYPRPPSLEPGDRHLLIEHAGVKIAETRRAYRVLETSHPPSWYLPPEDVRTDLLVPAGGRSLCEWKGAASYWHLRVAGQESPLVAWSYARPTAAFTAIAGYLSFYAGRVDACYVDGERVQPQAGDFYGGWITRDVIGPFKGAPGTLAW